MPNTLKQNVDKVVAATTAIGNAIVAKGGTVSAGDGLEEFPTAIATIPDTGIAIKTDTTGSGIKFIGDGNPLIRCDIEGNMDQQGTPSPSSIIMPDETGDKTANLFDKSNSVQGLLSTTDGSVDTSVDTYKTSDFIEITADNDYAMSVTSVYTYPRQIRMCVYDTNKNFISGKTSSAFNTGYMELGISAGNTAKYIRICYIYNDTEIMLNPGSALPYEPYGQYKTPVLSGGVTTPKYLGEVQSTRRIKKLVLTGDELWQVENQVIFYIEITMPIDSYKYVICSHFIPKSSYTDIVITDNTCGLSKRPALFIHYSGASTITDFKTYLQQQYAAGTPVTVWYVLADPTTGMVNEPIRKIGDYADSVSLTGIPTVAGLNEFQVTTTLPPSKATIEYRYIENIPTLDSKTITTNGTYNASDDNLDGYSSVTADVSGGTDVIFYDYDGSIVKSYSAEEFADVTALPDNPTHTGLTAQGWNWTLADAKTYVAQFGKLDVGQQYVTSDGATRIYITLEGEMTSPMLKLTVPSGSTVLVDWGDGSTPSTWTSSTTSEKHDYAAPGDYVISISATSGTYYFSTYFLVAGTTSSDLDAVYMNTVTKVELGTNITGFRFKYCSKLETISISSGTRNFGENCFHSCYNLKHVNIPANSSFGNGVFPYCNNLSSISIGNGLSELSYQTFAECTGFLERVILPNSCLTVDAAAFSNCNVAEIIFGNGITEIPGSLLYQRAPVKSVKLGNAVTLIGASAFYGTSISEITLPDTVVTINNSAFRNCYCLKKINGGQNVKTYGDYCFCGCKALSTFTIPDSVTNMNTNTFYQTKSLSNVTIGSGLTKLGNGAFQNCSGLYSITIPSTITELGTYAVNSCSNMKYIRFESTTPPTVAGSSTFGGVSTSTLIYVPTESINDYKSANNYPNPSSYNYVGYATYASGVSLPSSIPGYSLTWYATVEDWIAETNPITVGNGNEVYARTTAVTSITRETDFVNNVTTRSTDAIEALNVYRNMKRCNVADDGTINAMDGDLTYTENGSNGQVMVKVNKFYYKLDVSQTGDLDGVNIRKGRWSVADTKLDNSYKLHPAFLAADGVTELDYFLYGAFDGVGQDSEGVYSTSYNTTTYKLGSVGGNTYAPSNNFTRATVRTMAANRGTGWYQAGVKQTMALQMLFGVEYGFNSQLGLGYGVVNASAAAKTGITTGSISSGTKANQTTPVNWRGIENFWGNIWNYIDGLNINNRIPYVCDTFSFADNTSTGHTQIGFNVPEGSGTYVSAFGYDSNNDWVLLPSEATGADQNSAIGDTIYTNTSWRVAYLGGRWTYGFAAGLFCWVLFDDSSSAGSVRGSRLMYIPQAV